MADYNTMELMICAASRFLDDGRTAGVGTGAPCAAAMLAQKTHSPNLVILFEAGGMAPILPTMPVSVGDSRTTHKAVMASGMCDIMEACQRGMVDYTFLGGAQIDMYGNINSTLVGDYKKPKVRFPGSGGANDFASLCWRILMITPHDKRRFSEKLEFYTSPGFLTGKGTREEAGLPDDTGPYRIITNLAVLGFDDETARMKIESLHPGITLDQVKENTGFELLYDDDLPVTDEPTDEYLRILREEVDPNKYIIGR